MQNVLWYMSLFLAAVVIIAVIKFISKRNKRKKMENEIRKKWGMVPNVKYREQDMTLISGYFGNRKQALDKGEYIDDITWNDLDMDGVYKIINSTCTSAGEECLYSMLREPSFDEDGIYERDGMITALGKNEKLRIRLQMIMSELGKKRDSHVPDYLFNDGLVDLKGSAGYIILALMPALAILLFFMGYMEFILMLPIFMIINMTVCYSRKKVIEKDLEMLSYLVGIIRCARKMSKIMDGKLGQYKKDLDKYLKKVGSLDRKSVNLLYITNDPLVEYPKVMFLVEIISFEKSFNMVSKFKSELLEIYKIVGLIDSYISAASFRRSVLYYCVPMIRKKEKLSCGITAVDAYHPLLKKPVANTIHMDKPVLLTGSNASGKSTFLKTMAINALLAQTVVTCLAREYKSALFILYSSMALKDSIKDGESYYITEIKSLKRILDMTDNELPILCIIDEVLRGTNTIERIAASSEILNRMADERLVCMAATHDLELSSILGAKYANYHFQESFKGDDIVFDYKLYEGKSNTRNAIKLLDIMGYPDFVVKSATNRAQKFMDTGLWK